VVLPLPSGKVKLTGHGIAGAASRAAGCYDILMTSFVDISADRRLAYVKTDGHGPTVVFLGGFKSDMTGTKAMDLQDWAVSRGQAFLRLDYSGHGQSSGAFEDGCIGDWCADAAAIIATVTAGPLVLVGSSMGGWIALLLARAMPDRIAGLVGIAAAPDFTDWIWEAMSDPQRQELVTNGRIEHPSEYAAPPDIYTLRLIQDGRANRVMDSALLLPFPARFLQGSDDRDVLPSVAMRLLDHADGPDIQLTVVKGADHRFSSPACLTLIRATVEAMCGKSET
jgi:pimeloyl-ACP methyl ester carboxylesterase